MTSMQENYKKAPFVRKAEGLLLMQHPRYGQQLWTLGRYIGRKKRKPKSCAGCGKLLEKKEEVWRPITNVSNRMDRICLTCIPNKAK
jgi:hypothetical protein